MRKMGVTANLALFKKYNIILKNLKDYFRILKISKRKKKEICL